MAVSDRVEAAIVGRIDSLGLTLGTTPVVVEGKKMPKIERGLESSPRVQVSAADRGVPLEWLDTGNEDYPLGRKKVRYPVEITMTAPGDRDPTIVDVSYRDWREAILRAFEPPSVLGVAEVFDVETSGGPQYDRQGFARNLDNSRIDLAVVTVEPAGN